MTLSLSWPASLPPPILLGNSATYANVLPATNLVLQARPQGFEQSLVIAAPPTAPLVLDLPLAVTGATASLTDGGMLVLTDVHGVVVGTADPARMWGATTDPGTLEPTKWAMVPTSLVTTEFGQTLELRPDPAFFTDPGVTYPVTFDPAANLAVTVDTYIQQQTPTSGFASDTVLKSGPQTGIGLPPARSLLSFNLDPVLLGHVTSASLDLWESHSFSCVASKVDLWSVTGSFDSTVTWNTQPAVGSRYASLTVAKGFNATLCPAGTVTFSSGGDGGTTLTDLVQSWVDDPNVLPAVEIRGGDEGNPQTFKRFSSSEGTNPPVLHVTYNRTPDPPMGLKTTGASPLTLHGIFSDADGGTGRVKYTVYNASGAQVYIGLGTTVASGSDSPLTPPSGTLLSGYTWKAQGFDGTNYSAYGSVQRYPALAVTGLGPPWNVVVFMTDDLDLQTFTDALNATGCGANCHVPGGLLPNYYKYFVADGAITAPAVVFDNSFVSYSLCCPSRASFFTGQYAHNTMVKNNQGDNGGCKSFAGPLRDADTIATWLKTAGYNTAMIGKYLNGYGSDQVAGCRPRDPLPGWIRWNTLLYGRGHDASNQYGYAIDNSGASIKTDTTHQYQTTVLSNLASSLLGGVGTQPFFLYLAPSAPHLDKGGTVDSSCMYAPPPTYQWGNLPGIDGGPYEGAIDGNITNFNFLSLPHPGGKGNYNTSNADKNSAIRDFGNVTDACAEKLWWDRLESIMSIDDMIGTVAAKLNTLLLLDKTVMIFTSDNGYFNGEHRLHQKIAPYEEGLRVPLAIRYPALATGLQGTHSSAVVLNGDLAPTIADLAGAKAPAPTNDPTTNHAVDGQSLYSYLTWGGTWPRERFLAEHWPVTPGTGEGIDLAEGNDFYHEFHGIRTFSTGGTPDTANVLYVHYSSTANGDEYEYFPGLDTPANQLQNTNKCFSALNCPADIDSNLKDFLNDFLNCNATGLFALSGPATPTCPDIENATVNPPPAYIGLYPPSGKNGSVMVTVAGSQFPATMSYDLWYYPVTGTPIKFTPQVTTDLNGLFTATESFSTGSTTGVGYLKVQFGASVVAQASFSVTP